MSLNETAKRDARIVTLETELLDHSGHVRPEITTAQRRRLAREINVLRAANGWAPLNMLGR